jgi:hypothetical protein
MSVLVDSAEYFDDRFYRIKTKEGDKYIASVTTKLGIESKPFLYRWYADLGWDTARKKLNEAADRGKRIHYAFYIYMMGGTVLYNPWRSPNYRDEEIKKISNEKNGLICVLTEQSEMVDVWKLSRFYDVVKPKIDRCEFTVYSIAKDIAGTLDNSLKIQAGTYTVDGKELITIPKTGIYLVDLKTGNMVSESAWAQLAAYIEAFIDMMLGEPEGAIVLHTGSKKRTGIKGLSCLLKTRKELQHDYNIYKHLSAVFNARNPNMGPTVFQFPTLIQRSEVYT